MTAVGALVGERQRIHVALAQARRDARRLELDPRKPKHFRRAVDADRLARARAEQLDHPAGAGADIDQPAERPLAERRVDRVLDLAFGDMERADLVPHLGVAGEIAVGGLGAFGADRSRSAPRRRRTAPASLRPPSIDQREQRLDALGVGKRQENPAAFLAALEHAGVGEDLEVARHARLALPEHLRQLADRQLHQPQQRDDAQPRRVGKRLESIGKRECRSHQIRI